MCCDGASAASVGRAFGIDRLMIYQWMKVTGVKTGVKLTEEELTLALGDWKWKYPDGPNTKEQVKNIKKKIRDSALPDEPSPLEAIAGVQTTDLTVRGSYDNTLDRVRAQVLAKLSGDATVAGALKTTLAAAYIELLKESLANLPPVEKLSDLRTLQSLLFETLDIGGKEGPKRQGIDLRILNMDPKRIKVVDAVPTPEPIDVEVTSSVEDPTVEAVSDDDFEL